MDSEQGPEDAGSGITAIGTEMPPSVSALAVGKLPRYVEQAATSRTVMRRTRPSPLVGEGTIARELLGDEHGTSWDMMDWANMVLGKTGSNPPNSPRLLSSNPCHAPRCEACYSARGKAERRHGRGTPSVSVSNADGGVGERDGANRPLSPGEAKLWAKLAELKELPVHDSLAGFPEELDYSTIATMFNGQSSLRARLVRFLMECDKALTMRNTGYLNPLYHQFPTSTPPTVFATATTIDSTDVSPRPSSPVDDSTSMSTTSSQAGSENGRSQMRRWRWVMPGRTSSMSAITSGSDAVATAQEGARPAADPGATGVRTAHCLPAQYNSCPQSVSGFVAATANMGGIWRYVGGGGHSAGSESKFSVKRTGVDSPCTAPSPATMIDASPHLTTAHLPQPTPLQKEQSASTTTLTEVAAACDRNWRKNNEQEARNQGAMRPTVEDSSKSMVQLQGVRLRKSGDGDGASSSEESVSPADKSSSSRPTGGCSPRFSRAGNHQRSYAPTLAVNSASPGSWITETRRRGASRKTLQEASLAAGWGDDRLISNSWNVPSVPERPPSSASPPSPRHRAMGKNVTGASAIETGTNTAVAEERRLSGVSEETAKTLRNVRQLWERRTSCVGTRDTLGKPADETNEARNAARVRAGERGRDSDRERKKRPSPHLGSRGVGNLKAIFEKKSEPVRSPRSDGSRHKRSRLPPVAPVNVHGDDATTPQTVETSVGAVALAGQSIEELPRCDIDAPEPHASNTVAMAVLDKERPETLERSFHKRQPESSDARVPVPNSETDGSGGSVTDTTVAAGSSSVNVQAGKPPLSKRKMKSVSALRTKENARAGAPAVTARQVSQAVGAVACPTKLSEECDNILQSPVGATAETEVGDTVTRDEGEKTRLGLDPIESVVGLGYVQRDVSSLEFVLADGHDGVLRRKSEERTPSREAGLAAAIAAGNFLERNEARLTAEEQARAAVEILERLVGQKDLTQAANMQQQEARSAAELLKQIVGQKDMTPTASTQQQEAQAAVELLEQIVGQKDMTPTASTQQQEAQAAVELLEQIVGQKDMTPTASTQQQEAQAAVELLEQIVGQKYLTLAANTQQQEAHAALKLLEQMVTEGEASAEDREAQARVTVAQLEKLVGAAGDHDKTENVETGSGGEAAVPAVERPQTTNAATVALAATPATTLTPSTPKQAKQGSDTEETTDDHGEGALAVKSESMGDILSLEASVRDEQLPTPVENNQIIRDQRHQSPDAHNRQRTPRPSRQVSTQGSKATGVREACDDPSDVARKETGDPPLVTMVHVFSNATNVATAGVSRVTTVNGPAAGKHKITLTQNDLFKYGILGPMIVDDIEVDRPAVHGGGGEDDLCAKDSDPYGGLFTRTEEGASVSRDDVSAHPDTAIADTPCAPGPRETAEEFKGRQDPDCFGPSDGTAAVATDAVIDEEHDTLPAHVPCANVGHPVSTVAASSGTEDVGEAPHFGSDLATAVDGVTSPSANLESGESRAQEEAEQVVDLIGPTAPTDALCSIPTTITGSEDKEKSGNSVPPRLQEMPQAPQTPQTPLVEISVVTTSLSSTEGVDGEASAVESTGSLASPPIMMERLSAGQTAPPRTAFPASAIAGSPSLPSARRAAMLATSATPGLSVAVETTDCNKSMSSIGAKTSSALSPRLPEHAQSVEHTHQLSPSPLRVLKHPTLPPTLPPGSRDEAEVVTKHDGGGGTAPRSSAHAAEGGDVPSPQLSPLSRGLPLRAHSPKTTPRRQSLMHRIQNSVTELLFDMSPDAGGGGGAAVPVALSPRGVPPQPGIADSSSLIHSVGPTGGGAVGQSRKPLCTPNMEKIPPEAGRSGFGGDDGRDGAVPPSPPDSPVAAPAVTAPPRKRSAEKGRLRIAVSPTHAVLPSPRRGSLSPGPWAPISLWSWPEVSPRRRASLSPGPRAVGLSPSQETSGSSDLPQEAVLQAAPPSGGGQLPSRTGGRGLSALQQATSEKNTISAVSTSPLTPSRALIRTGGSSVAPKGTAASTIKSGTIKSSARPTSKAPAADEAPSDGAYPSRIAGTTSRLTREDGRSTVTGHGGTGADSSGGGGGGGENITDGSSGGSGGGDSGNIGGHESGGGCQSLASELPKFVAEAISLVGSLRTLAACQAVSRAWCRAVGGDRGEALFGGIVRAVGVPASLRPAVWHKLVVRAVSCSRNGGDGRIPATPTKGSTPTKGDAGFSSRNFGRLVEAGRTGPHGALIARDIPRAFGSVAPHKRRELGDGSMTTFNVAAASAAAGSGKTTTASTLPTAPEPKKMWFAAAAAAITGARHPGDLGGVFVTGGRVDRGDVERDGGGGTTNIGGFGLLSDFLGLGPDQQQRERPLTTQTSALNSRRASISLAGLTGSAGSGPWPWLPPAGGRAMPGGTRRGASPPRLSLSLSPPRSNRRIVCSPPGSPPLNEGKNRRLTMGGRSSASAAAAVSELAGGAPVLVPMAFNGADSQWDAAWLAAAEAAWEDVPVEAKRQCLGNVLFAIAARFPDVGYCQGMDRLVAMLMKFYFIKPEDTMIGSGGQRRSSAPSPSCISLPESPSPHESTAPTPSLSRAASTFFPADKTSLVSSSPSTTTAAAVAPVSSAAAQSDQDMVDEGGPGSSPDSASGSRRGEGRDNAPRLAEEGARKPSALPLLADLSFAEEHEKTMPRRLLGERVYTVFAGLFEGFRLHDLYVPEKGGVLVCTEVLHLLARRRLPKLAAHFDAIDFSLDMVAMGWFQTLFVYLHAMPRATVRRIWDWWLSCGDFEVFFRVSMALLKLSEGALIGQDFDSTVEYFNNFPQPHVLAPDVLLPCAAAAEVEDGELMYLELQVRRKEGLEVSSVTQLMLRPVL